MQLDYFKLTPLFKINENYIIKYNDIQLIQETYNLNYNDIIHELCYINKININDIIIAINESDIILNPDVIKYIPYKIVVIPISENNIIYQFCEDCIDAYLKTENEEYINLLLDDNKIANIVKKGNNTNKLHTHITKTVYQAKKTYRENTPRINMFTGKINYLHEEKKPVHLTYDLRDFAGPDAEEKMKMRINHAYKTIINNNKKAIADKIAALNHLGNKLKQREEKSLDIIVKEKLQGAFDKVKYAAKRLLYKITPSFLK